MSIDDSGARRTKITRPKKPAKMDSKILANHDDARYVDLPEPQDSSRKGGAKTHSLLLESSRRCYRLDNGQENHLVRPNNHQLEQNRSFVASRASDVM
jgi:hypothetical protein